MFQRKSRMKLPIVSFKKKLSVKPAMVATEAEVASHEEHDGNISGQSRSLIPITSFYQSIESDLESSGGQPQRDETRRDDPNHGNRRNSAPPHVVGLTDEYTSWTDSLQAFKGAIFHSIFYLAAGTLAYSVVFEKWPIVDSLYFAVVLFTTVGYGDLHPNTPGGEIFTLIFALYGIVIVGVLLGIVAEMTFQRRQNLHQKSMGEVRRKYMEIFTHSSSFESEDVVEAKEKVSFFAAALWICRAQAPAFAVLCAIATPVVLLEQWTFVKGLYWGVITGTTIGLGDETPQRQLSRAICVLFVPLAAAFTGRTLSLIAGAYIYNNCRAVEEEFFSRTLTIGDLNEMDIDSDGVVSSGEFLVFMLLTLQKCKKEDVEDILTLFNKLDTSGDGMLSREDLELGIRRTSVHMNIPTPDRRQPRGATRHEPRNPSPLRFFGQANNFVRDH